MTGDREVWSMLMIKNGGISCSETSVDMFGSLTGPAIFKDDKNFYYIKQLLKNLPSSEHRKLFWTM